MDWMPLATMGFGLIQKHLFTKLPNNIIPWVNTAACVGVAYATGDNMSVGGALETGIAWSGIATLGHQAVKVPVKKAAGISL